MNFGVNDSSPLRHEITPVLEVPSPFPHHRILIISHYAFRGFSVSLFHPNFYSNLYWVRFQFSLGNAVHERAIVRKEALHKTVQPNPNLNINPKPNFNPVPNPRLPQSSSR